MQANKTMADQEQEIARLTDRLDRVLVEWAELDERNDELEEKLASQARLLLQYAEAEIDTAHQIADMEETLASREQRVEKYASQSIALKHQLSAMQQDAQAAQQDRTRRREADYRSTTALFLRFRATFDEPELEDPHLAAISQRAFASPHAPGTAYAVRETLAFLLRSWEAEMADTPARLSEFKRLWLDSLDTQIAELELHKRALHLLHELDREDWYRVKFGRRALHGAQIELTQHAERALQAVRTARLVLDCQASPEAAFASMELAYKLVRATRDHEASDLVSNGASDIDIDIHRVACAIQEKIDTLVASGTRYVVKRTSTPPPKGAFRWEIAIPEPRVATAYVDAGGHSAPVPIEQPRSSHEPEPLHFNPANGMPMNGGMSGFDIYGNAYGTNLNDP